MSKKPQAEIMIIPKTEDTYETRIKQERKEKQRRKKKKQDKNNNKMKEQYIKK